MAILGIFGYNWGNYAAYGGESCNSSGSYRKINMIGNYYKAGPATPSSKASNLLRITTACYNCTESQSCSTIVPAHFYMSGNNLSDVAEDGPTGITVSDYLSSERFKASDTQWDYNTISIQTASTCFNKVLAYAGASYSRDAVDTRIVSEANNGTTTYTGTYSKTEGIIDSQDEVGGWPDLTGTAATDTDGDGIPDAWEDANGLDKTSSADALTYTLDNKGYYTNLEVYANNLVESAIKAGRADATETFDEYYPTVASTAGEVTSGEIFAYDFTTLSAAPANGDASTSTSLFGTTTISYTNAGLAFNSGLSYGKSDDVVTIDLPVTLTTKDVVTISWRSGSGNKAISYTLSASGVDSYTAPTVAAKDYTSQTSTLTVGTDLAWAGVKTFTIKRNGSGTFILHSVNITRPEAENDDDDADDDADTGQIPARTATWSWQSGTPSTITNTNLEGTSGTVDSDIDGVVLTVNASSSSGKLKYNTAGYAQFNSGTVIQVPVRKAGDEVTVVSYPGQYNYTVGGTAASANTTVYEATSTDAAQGYVEIVATATSYLYSISVNQKAYTEGSETPAENTVTVNTYMWDFSAPEASFAGKTVQKTTGSWTSSADSNGNTVDLYIDATSGKLAQRSSSSPQDAQFNQNTLLRVPVISSNDVVTVVARSNSANVTIGGEAMASATVQHTASIEEANQGYVEIVAATGGAYLTSITVKQMTTVYAVPTLKSFTIDGQIFSASSVFTDGVGAVALSSLLTFPASTSDITVEANYGTPTVTNLTTTASGATVTIEVTKGNQTSTYTLTLTQKTGYILSYYDIDGSLLGTQQIDENDAIGTFAYTTSNLNVSAGKTGRAWFTAPTGGVRIPATQVITSNLSLYSMENDPIEKNANGYYMVLAGDADHLIQTIKAAGAAATSTSRSLVFIPNGTYDFSYIALTEVPAYVSLIGESQSGVIIKNTPAIEGISVTATLKPTGSEVYMQDLTLSCIAPYGSNGANAERGVALQDAGDKTAYYNVSLLGLQDTYYSSGREGMRSYWKNGYIEGTVDYLCGFGNVLFDGCTFKNVARSTGTAADVIAAPNTYPSEVGYVFNSCTIDGISAQAGKYSLGRPWLNMRNSVADSPAAYYLYCTMKQQPLAAGWTKWNDNDNSAYTIRMAEYGSVDADGNTLDLSSRSNAAFNASSASLDAVLTEDAAQTVLSDIATALTGSDAWDYQAATAQVTAKATLTGLHLTLDSDAPAYLIEKDGEFVALITDLTYDFATEGNYTVRAANSMGGFGDALSLSVSASTFTISACGYTTFSPTTNVHIKMSEGVEVGVVTGIHDDYVDLKFYTAWEQNWWLAAGDCALFHGNAGDIVTFETTPAGVAMNDENLLVGVPSQGQAWNDGKGTSWVPYFLGYDDKAEAALYRYENETTDALLGHAYLPVPITTSSNARLRLGKEATAEGIEMIENTKAASGRNVDILGRPTDANAKGLRVVDGKVSLFY